MIPRNTTRASTCSSRRSASAGGLALAGLLLVLGLVMTSNANFAKGYVKDQLIAQNIIFKAETP